MAARGDDEIIKLMASKPMQNNNTSQTDGIPEHSHPTSIPTRSKEETLNQRKAQQKKPSITINKEPLPETTGINLSIPRSRGQLRNTIMLPIPGVTPLIGKKVNNKGDIVDEKGAVLGKATGIIDDIAGKKISKNGEILDDDGNVIGKVGEVAKTVGDLADDKPRDPASRKSVPLDGLLGRIVTDTGTLVDEDGRIIGRVEGDITEMVGRIVRSSGEVLNDWNQVVGRVSENLLVSSEDEDPPEEEIGDDHKTENKRASISDSDGETKKAGGAAPNGAPQDGADQGGDPTDIYLNIQSTKEAITITIRVPTVFRNKFNE